MCIVSGWNQEIKVQQEPPTLWWVHVINIGREVVKQVTRRLKKPQRGRSVRGQTGILAEERDATDTFLPLYLSLWPTRGSWQRKDLNLFMFEKYDPGCFVENSVCVCVCVCECECTCAHTQAYTCTWGLEGHGGPVVEVSKGEKSEEAMRMSHEP